MSEIERFTGRDAKTIIKMVEEDGFPAKMVRNRWQAVVEDVLEWYRNYQGFPENGS